MHKRPDQFRLGNYRYIGRDLSELRWTVDEPEDFLFVQKVYEALYPKNSAFTTADALNLLSQQSELVEINKGFKRNEG